MSMHLFSALMGLLAGAILAFFGPPLWFMHRRLKLGPKHRALLVTIRAALDEAGRVATALGDDVAAERIATLRAMREEFILGSLTAVGRWHDLLLQVTKLGVYTPPEQEVRRPLHIAIWRAVETLDTLVLMLANPGAFDPSDPRRA